MSTPQDASSASQLPAETKEGAPPELGPVSGSPPVFELGIDKTNSMGFFWINPWDGRRELVATLWWPIHPVEKTEEVEKLFESLELRVRSGANDQADGPRDTEPRNPTDIMDEKLSASTGAAAPEVPSSDWFASLREYVTADEIAKSKRIFDCGCPSHEIIVIATALRGLVEACDDAAQFANDDERPLKAEEFEQRAQCYRNCYDKIVEEWDGNPDEANTQ